MTERAPTQTPRLTTVLGVARGVLLAVGPRVAVPALVAEYGWDVTFQALALLRNDDAREAFGLTWSLLLLEPLADELAGGAPAEEALRDS